MIRFTTAAVVVVVAALSGCTSVPAERFADRQNDGLLSEIAHAEHEKPRSGFGLDQPTIDREGGLVRDQDIAQALERRLGLRAGARVAVVEAQSLREWVNVPTFGEPSSNVERTVWSARPATADALRELRLAFGVELQEGAACPLPVGRIQSVGTVPGLFLPDRADLARVRYAAARVGSDVVLVYALSSRINAYRNGLAWLYPTLLGLALPGQSTLVLSRAEGALVDARTGIVHVVGQGSGRADRSSSPLASSGERVRRATEEAEREALGELARELAASVARLDPPPPVARERR